MKKGMETLNVQQQDLLQQYEADEDTLIHQIVIDVQEVHCNFYDPALDQLPFTSLGQLDRYFRSTIRMESLARYLVMSYKFYEPTNKHFLSVCSLFEL